MTCQIPATEFYDLGKKLIAYADDFGELEDLSGVAVLEALAAVAAEDEEGGGADDDAVPLLPVPLRRLHPRLPRRPSPRVLLHYCSRILFPL